MHNLLHEKYYNIGKTERYLVQMRSQTRASGITLQVHGVTLQVHGVIKNLDANIHQRSKVLDP